MPKISHPTQPLADVNVLPQQDGSHDIVACFSLDPLQIFGEGDNRAYLACDASVSIRQMYGYGGAFGGLPNYMQGVARKIGSILASITFSGTASAIYWAVAPDGSKIEEIGELDEAAWENAFITGPKKEKWGRGTKLLPVIKYGYEKIAKGAKSAIGVIITDGIIDDEKECFKYCLNLGKSLQGNKPDPFKLILIGIGEAVDQGQLERFDDMFEGTGIDYDLFSSGLVASLQNEDEILGVLFGELASDLVATTGSVESGSGQILAKYPDGLPGKIRFTLPKDETKFVIRTPAGDLTQDISEALV